MTVGNPFRALLSADRLLSRTARALALIGAAAVAALAACSADDEASPTPAPVATESAVYSSPAFGVEFEYAPGWLPDSDYQSYEGVEISFADPRGREYGFFLVDACCSGDVDLDEATELQAGHKLKPFGEQPTVTSVPLPAGEGRLIMPDDSAPEPYSAALLLPYESPHEVSLTGAYKFLILHAHKDFIRDIGQSIRFND